jgi:hypothetical protein
MRIENFVLKAFSMIAAGTNRFRLSRFQKTLRHGHPQARRNNKGKAAQRNKDPQSHIRL